MDVRAQHRILDANFNRSREGLRVCEEITRFILKEKAITRSLKNSRHEVTECLKRLPMPYAQLVSARDVRADVGKKTSARERKRKNTLDFFLSNMGRVKESLRVLEEILKFFEPRLSARVKKIRFTVYAIEKRALPKLAALHHN